MTIGERIKELRKALDLTQQEFATKIGTTRNNIAGYETGRREPSAAAINLIIAKLNVAETWLRTGEGEMFVQQSREDEIAAAVNQLLSGESTEFKRRLITVLATLKDEQWIFLEDKLREILDARPAVSDSEAEKQAELEREADAFAAIARQQFLSEKLRESQASSAKQSGGPGGVA